MASCVFKAGLFLSAVLLLASPAAACDSARSAEPVNLVRDVPGLTAAISVDSTFHGYGARVLGDGKWIERGKEITQDYASKDRLGNGGNTWVSAETDTEHWVRVDWRQPVVVNQVEIWWSRLEWQRVPRRIAPRREVGSPRRRRLARGRGPA